jgi:hypothetical protein
MYGRQKRDQERRDTKAAFAEATAANVWHRPPAVEWNVVPDYETALLDAPGHVFVFKQAYWRGKYVDFAIVDEVRGGAENPCVARADTSMKHDYVHYHVCSRVTGEDLKNENIAFIGDQDALHGAYDTSYDTIIRHAIEHEKMWRNG